MATRVHVEVKDDGSIGMNVNMVLDILLYTVDAVKEALLLCTKQRTFPENSVAEQDTREISWDFSLARLSIAFSGVSKDGCP